jgi:sirohydrochlorin cobaltochelatase
MQRVWFLSMMVAALSLLAVRSATAGEEGKKSPKKAILLVAFGTSVPEAQPAYAQVDAAVKKAFPETEIRWAYTSKVIRAKLARQGKPLDSPEMALVRLMDEGFTRVAVLSLHVIPGIEFHDLNTNAQLFSRMTGGFERVAVARPLLSSHEDMVQVTAALLKKVPASRKPDDIVIFMGHGSEKHPSDAIYAAMSYLFEGLDPNVFVATVGGYPSLADLLPKITERKARKAYLIPLMAVAGDHARNDMAGDGPDSWKSILTGKGLACEAVLSGMAEYPEVVEVWLRHLREVFAEL